MEFHSMLLRSPYWDEMVSAISQVPGYKAPSYERARTTLLDNEKDRVRKSLQVFSEKWEAHGVAVVSDGWTSLKNQSLINILPSNCLGSMFLYAHDFSAVEKSGKNISDFLLTAIEGIGPSNVVQVITDNAANCKAAGQEVEQAYKHIFWSPCMVHTLNLIFKDLAREFFWMKETYTSGKDIVKYITNHSQALSIFRSHSKLELLKVAKTRFASHYITLKRLLVVREALLQTVVSNAWRSWTDALVDEESGKLSARVKIDVMSDAFWDSVRIVLSMTKPIYKMIKFTDQEGPLIGEVYEPMYNMLGEINDNLQGTENCEEIYQKVHQFVCTRWGKMMNVKLHSLAYALTPKYYDSEYLKLPAPGGFKRVTQDQDNEVVDDAMKGMEKMAGGDLELRDLLREQFVRFVTKKGRFGSPLASREARNPKMSILEWWRFHGGDTPELRTLAIKVLSQSITTSSAERAWSTYSYILNVKRNRLNAARADTLVYIHSNLRLLSRLTGSYKDGPHRKWDINPEIPLIDDSAVRMEDMRWENLDDPLQLVTSDVPLPPLRPQPVAIRPPQPSLPSLTMLDTATTSSSPCDAPLPARFTRQQGIPDFVRGGGRGIRGRGRRGSSRVEPSHTKGKRKFT
ncbi:uncharacterized protein LOC143885176 [Tasmannia lanceolata]|uniref:uncharacterized protein LOC143885176 n=1 Tax=Tasmannia lanceolata TaxID=3420 RepID=UPI004064C4D5